MSTENTHPDDEQVEEQELQTDAAAPDADMLPTDAELDGDLAAADQDVDADTDTDNDAAIAPTDEDDMTAQLAAVEAQAADYLDSLQRERAAFQNYKRRVERERAEQKQLIEGELLLKLLPVLDDFYRALDAVPEAEQDDWYAGVALILKKFERYLADAGVTEIEAQGAVFDPLYHAAIGVDTASDAASDTVTLVLQRGYMLGDRVLRPAMVRVAG